MRIQVAYCPASVDTASYAGGGLAARGAFLPMLISTCTDNPLPLLCCPPDEEAPLFTGGAVIDS